MNTKPLLILSLALNVVFGVVISTTLSPETDSTLGLSGTGNYSESPLGQVATNSQQVVTNTVVKQMTWETVEAADYREYIENLRNIDCPEETTSFSPTSTSSKKPSVASWVVRRNWNFGKPTPCFRRVSTGITPRR